MINPSEDNSNSISYIHHFAIEKRAQQSIKSIKTKKSSTRIFTICESITPLLTNNRILERGDQLRKALNLIRRLNSMSREEKTVRVIFEYPDHTTEKILAKSEAKELEIMAVSGVFKRLIREVLRVTKAILESKEEKIKKKDLVRGRGGDKYRAIKYLKSEGLVEDKKGIITVNDISKLKALKDELSNLV